METTTGHRWFNNPRGSHGYSMASHNLVISYVWSCHKTAALWPVTSNSASSSTNRATNASPTTPPPSDTPETSVHARYQSFDLLQPRPWVHDDDDTDWTGCPVDGWCWVDGPMMNGRKWVHVLVFEGSQARSNHPHLSLENKHTQLICEDCPLQRLPHNCQPPRAYALCFWLFNVYNINNIIFFYFIYKTRTMVVERLSRERTIDSGNK